MTIPVGSSATDTAARLSFVQSSASRTISGSGAGARLVGRTARCREFSSVGGVSDSNVGDGLRGRTASLEQDKLDTARTVTAIVDARAAKLAQLFTISDAW